MSEEEHSSGSEKEKPKENSDFIKVMFGSNVSDDKLLEGFKSFLDVFSPNGNFQLNEVISNIASKVEEATKCLPKETLQSLETLGKLLEETESKVKCHEDGQEKVFVIDSLPSESEESEDSSDSESDSDIISGLENMECKMTYRDGKFHYDISFDTDCIFRGNEAVQSIITS